MYTLAERECIWAIISGRAGELQTHILCLPSLLPSLCLVFVIHNHPTNCQVYREHMVNFVHVEGKKYMVDVGFGSPGPIRPLLLPQSHSESHSEAENEQVNIRPASVRLVREPIAPNVDRSRSQDMWIYQLRNNKNTPAPSNPNSTQSTVPPSENTETTVDSKTTVHNDISEWTPIYAFTETEFIPRDFANMATASAFRRNNFFNWTLVAVRMIMRDELPYILSPLSSSSSPSSLSSLFVKIEEGPPDEIVGTLILTTSKVKVIVANQKIDLRTFNNEEERLEALKVYFGIELSEEERAGVMGSAIDFERIHF